MNFEALMFYGFSATLIFTSAMVVFLRNPVRCVLFLVFAFITTAGLWLLLEAEFLALILVLVYVGAVMTLFLFVIMMMNVETASLRQGFVRYLPFGLFVIAALLTLMVIAVGPQHFGLGHIPAPQHAAADYSNVRELGNVLYTDYVFPFEIAGVILLVAIISAITLTFRGPQQRKKQRVAEQIRVRSEDRLKIVKMPSEKKV